MFSNGSPADTFDENFDSSAFEPSGVFSCSYLPILSQLAIVPKLFAQQEKLYSNTIALRRMFGFYWMQFHLE